MDIKIVGDKSGDSHSLKDPEVVGDLSASKAEFRIVLVTNSESIGLKRFPGFVIEQTVP